MSKIVTILRAAHCHSTHHYFALDALRNLQTAQAQRLANLLLKYHDDYLTGAKAPDTNFKDFRNHVVHVSHGNWGGAPQKCAEWLQIARGNLDQGKWKKAAYACGVLSHYFTDPIMPLHTGQNPRENIVHRPMEWSIYKSYDEIYQKSVSDGFCARFEFADSQDWISNAVLASATMAHRHYDRLIELFDLNSGPTDLTSGLNGEARQILAELFALAIDGWAGVLTRLADETNQQLPNVSLTLPSILASIDKPLAWIVRRISDASERRAVQAIYTEFKKKGIVERNLPAEVRAIQAAIKADSQYLHLTPLSADGNQGVGVFAESLTDANDRRKQTAAELISSASIDQFELPSENVAVEPVAAQDAQPLVPMSGLSTTEKKLLSEEDSATFNRKPHGAKTDIAAVASEVNAEEFVSLSEARSRVKLHRHEENPEDEVLRPPSKAPVIEHNVGHSSRGTSELAPRLKVVSESLDTDPKSRIMYGSPLVEAPSIGPKTAKRFSDIGVHTIAQFVGASPEELVASLVTRWITESLIRDWQDQARLACEVPTLPGYAAQLLVCVGCRTSWQLRTTGASLLQGQLESLCMTAEGQQILRSAKLPSAEQVQRWIDSAKEYARRNAA